MLSQEQSKEITRNEKLSLMSNLEAALRAAKNSSDLSAVDAEQLKSLLTHLNNSMPAVNQATDNHERDEALLKFQVEQLQIDLIEWSKRKKANDEYTSRYGSTGTDVWLSENREKLFERCNQIVTQDRRIYEPVFTDQNLNHEFFIHYLFSNPEAFKKIMNSPSFELLNRFVAILCEQAIKEENDIVAKKYVNLITEMVIINKTLTRDQRQVLLIEIIFNLVTHYWTSINMDYRDDLSVKLLEQIDDLNICNDSGKSLVQIMTEGGSIYFPKSLNFLLIRNATMSNLDLESILRGALDKNKRCEKTFVESICKRLMSDSNWNTFINRHGGNLFVAQQYQYIGECHSYDKHTSENMYTYASALMIRWHELYHTVLQAHLQNDKSCSKRVLGFLRQFSTCEALRPLKKDLCLSLFAYLAEDPLICSKLRSNSSELIDNTKLEHPIDAILNYSIAMDHPEKCPLALAVKKKNANYILLILQIYSDANRFEPTKNEYITKQIKHLKRSGGDISSVISYLQDYTNSWNPLTRYSFEAKLLAELTPQQQQQKLIAGEIFFSSRDMKNNQKSQEKQSEPELREPLIETEATNELSKTKNLLM